MKKYKLKCDRKEGISFMGNSARVRMLHGETKTVELSESDVEALRKFNVKAELELPKMKAVEPEPEAEKDDAGEPESDKEPEPDKKTGNKKTGNKKTDNKKK